MAERRLGAQRSFAEETGELEKLENGYVRLEDLKNGKNLEGLMSPRECEGFFPVFVQMERLAGMGRPVMAAIDGRCGSGKTRLAGLIERLFSCNVLHMDDFYLPPNRRPWNWREVPGGNMDFERLRRELLVPLGEGREAFYRPYSCALGETGEEKRLAPRGLTVVEGSYSQHPLLKAQYELTVFLTCDGEERRKRLQMREGEGLEKFEKIWIPMEESYFKSFLVESGSSLRVDTSGFFGYNE